MKTLNAFFADTSGAVSIEYGMIAALISTAMLSFAPEMSADIHAMYLHIANAFG